MLHTKFRGNRPAGSGEEDSPYPRRLHIKFGFDQASGFGEDV